jgi:hypothetical protein
MALATRRSSRRAHQKAEIESAGRRLAGVGDQQLEEPALECPNGTPGCHGGHGPGLPCMDCFINGGEEA